MLLAMRVPPKRSVTVALARSSATAADRCARAGVNRVNEVANANTSASRVRVSARMRCRYAVAWACIERLTSHSMTTRRGRCTGRVRTSWIGSHPVRRERATVGRNATR